MSKRGGFPGGMNGFNMNAMLKQAKKMQADLEDTQKNLNNKMFSSTSGGGAVKVVISGDKQIKELKISQDVIDSKDVEMLEDLILTCINDAMKKVDDETQAQMSKFNIPGMF